MAQVCCATATIQSYETKKQTAPLTIEPALQEDHVYMDVDSGDITHLQVKKVSA